MEKGSFIGLNELSIAEIKTLPMGDRLFDLTGKTALITGASGGIGSAIAKILHKQGATVVISGTNIESLQALAAELKDRVIIEVCNLHDDDQVANLVDKAYAYNDRLDILVCNAGVTKDNLALRMDVEDFDVVLKINLRATFVLNKAAIKKMMKQRWGRIINVSSVVGFTGNLGQANYTAAKAGIVAMSKTFAQEVASRNITVNSIAPGFISTAMTDKLKPEFKEDLLKKIPCGRFGIPEDIANGVLFLASSESSYVTGQTLHVNGGMAML